MSRGPSPIVRRRRLGGELRRLREAANMTGDMVIARVGWASASKLSRLENGRSRPDLGDVLDLLDIYGVRGPARDELVAVARDAGNTRGWLREYPVMTQRQRGYAELESGCVDIREYSPAIVPGLLQTQSYTRVRIMSSKLLPRPDDEREFDPESEVAARLARQAILSRRTDPPRYEVVLDESALTSRCGAEVMRDQLIHLHRLGQLSNVTLRVLPRDSVIGDLYLPHTGFSLYRFADPGDAETIAVESLGHDLVLTEKLEISRYTMVFTWLREAALSAEESLDWLADAADAVAPSLVPSAGLGPVSTVQPPATTPRSAPRPRRSG